MNQRDAINKILNSSYLKDIYFYVVDKEFFMQKELLKNTKIKYPAHISKSLKDLRELGIIICENPKDKNYKRYQTTPKAKEIKKDIIKYQ